ncbi:MipA/OmpV family protein [Paracoccus bogoriensis]|uniref:MipA/OmpV family protein n=1 Tax=Paracoccus bogoriensis TaxID=242065 RepID=UPI001C673296|nr:MipA/OmpV family protein [Paracoccus bogoriensis]MBW7056413.1 MipA/OmpV family protein [Paracoccus bogoriensis]
MKYALALALAASFSAVTPLQAQVVGRAVDLDLGLGVELGPSYPGADDGAESPWLILRNRAASDGQGFSVSPSFGLKGKREASDGDLLDGLEPIDRSVEVGLRLGYGLGPLAAYVTARRGFGGHEGVTGAVGLRYRTELSPEMTLWSGVQAAYGNARFNNTYFGITDVEASASGLPAYAPGAGFNEAAITFEARYALSDSTALLGEVRYGKLIGDAADSPVVAETYQPSLRLGVVRRFSFGF